MSEIRIGCIAEIKDPQWTWIKDMIDYPRPLQWEFFRAAKMNTLERLIPKPHMGRVRAALETRRAAKQGKIDLVVSHMPYCIGWTAKALGKSNKVPHLGFAFNFTDLPTGWRRNAMVNAFRLVDRFAVFSHMERDLYSHYFDIPRSKIDRVPWGVARPICAAGEKTINGRYFVAMGGEARDYRTLAEAARMMPTTQFVFIVRPWSLDGLALPENVKVLVNVPWHEAWTLVFHARSAIIPLRDSMTPCGHVTLVGGMHLGKAHIITDSLGITDYVAHDETGLLVPAKDANALRLAIERINDDDELVIKLGTAAQAFAQEHCSEDNTSRYFASFLDKTFG